jgi:hypothetical protein
VLCLHVFYFFSFALTYFVAGLWAVKLARNNNLIEPNCAIIFIITVVLHCDADARLEVSVLYRMASP